MSSPPSILKDFKSNLSDQLYITEDGHKVRSRGEALIDNWLFYNEIQHVYEKEIPVSESVSIQCDFYLPKYNIYIEYWGFDEDEEYQLRKKEKENLYEMLNLCLFSVENKHIFNLDRHLNKLLIKGREVIKGKESELNILSISEINRMRSVKRKTLHDKRILGIVFSDPIQRESYNGNPYILFCLQIKNEFTVVQVWGDDSVENIRIARNLQIGDEILIHSPVIPSQDWVSADVLVNERISRIFRLI